MISKNEIMQHAKKYNLNANMIEKDYILNWVLFGISASKELKDKWIFKGGTCLKKCFFKEYRFSEDLDFTILDSNHIDEEFLSSEFTKISDWIFDLSGIVIPKEDIKFEKYSNPRGYVSVQGKIPYRGPMQRRGNTSTLKLDLTNDEILVTKPVLSEIFHPYSDVNDNNKIQAYKLEEIFAEKLRTLVERLSPRDLYDVINLYLIMKDDVDKKELNKILIKKCEYKKVSKPSFSVINSLPIKEDLPIDWDNMLRHQISSLKKCDFYWEQLPEVFDWLES